MIGVKMNDNWVVGQYGQWDGYPEGQGYAVLDFLRNFNEEKFRENLAKCVFIDKKRIRECYVECGDSPDNNSGFIEFKVAQAFAKKFPNLSRDTGAGILNYIANSASDKIELWDEHEFMDDSWCEFAYVLDMDTRTLTCYCGKDKVYAEYSFDEIPENNECLKIIYDEWFKKTYPDDGMPF
jgi:hypothetical protein